VATGTNITANSALGVDPTSPFEATSSSSLPIIIGVVVGVLLLVAVIGAGLCWYRRKSREHIELLKPMPEGFTPEIFSQVDDEGQIHLRDLYRQMNRDIPPEILYRQEVIGQGAFGKVYRGVLYENKTFSAVAIKEVQDATGDNAMELLDEANLMRRLHHSCIVSCIGICSETRKPGEPGYIEPESVGAKDDEHTHVAMTTGEEREVEVDPMLNVIRVSIVLEFLPCGDLKDYLDKNTINMTEKLWYVQQMARGMAYLEREGIVHRDLAARNCMLGTGGPASFGFPYLKVSDFGLSRQIRDDKSYYTMTHQGKVPARWLPPESYRLLKFSSKSDAWAFGVTTWEIFSNGKIPYENMNLALVLEQLENCVLRLSCPQGCPDDVFNDLMMNTWANAPDDRPDFQQLMNCATHKMKMYSDVFCEVVMVEEETGDITIMPVDEPNFDDAMGDNEVSL
ncbi:TK protein kinase, partial [Sphaeroforma arctica JP610]